MSDQLPHSELLSAYLDNELGSEQRALVEKLIAEDSRYARLLESWQSHGERLRTLPRQQLGDDFASSVIAAATKPSHATPANSQPPSGESNWRIGLASIAALAALLLASVFMFPPEVSKSPAVARMDSMAVDSERMELGDGLDESSLRESSLSTGGQDLLALQSAPAAASSGNTAMAFKAQPDNQPAAGQLAAGATPTVAVDAIDQNRPTDFASRNQPRRMNKKHMAAADESVEALQEAFLDDEIEGQAAMSEETGEGEDEGVRSSGMVELEIELEIERDTDRELAIQAGQLPENVLLIDLTRQGSQRQVTMADVRRVLSENLIQIQPTVSDAPGDLVNAQTRNKQAPGMPRVEQSESKWDLSTEALLVVSTPVQMQSAIEELSRTTRISAIAFPAPESRQHDRSMVERQRQVAGNQAARKLQSDSGQRGNLAYPLVQQSLNERSAVPPESSDKVTQAPEVRTSKESSASKSQVAGQAAVGGRKSKGATEMDAEPQSELAKRPAKRNERIQRFFTQQRDEAIDSAGQANYLLIVQQPQAIPSPAAESASPASKSAPAER